MAWSDAKRASAPPLRRAGALPWVRISPKLCNKTAAGATGHDNLFTVEPETMCQLLGMNCNTQPISCSPSKAFTAAAARPTTMPTAGASPFREQGRRIFLDDKPSVESPAANLVRNYPIKSENVIAHIRKATQGEVNLANTHPFMREMWGRYWIFAHNGNLIISSPRPVATTTRWAAPTPNRPSAI